MATILQTCSGSGEICGTPDHSNVAASVSHLHALLNVLGELRPHTTHDH